MGAVGRRAFAMGCFAVLPQVLVAQQPVSLGKPDAEFPEAFTKIGSIRELGDGRVLVIDSKEQTVQLVDFRSGRASPVGRKGSGPGEYGNPSRLIALPDDSSAIFDPSNARYLIVRPDGTPGSTFQIEIAGAVRFGGRGSAPRGTDAIGRIFVEGSNIVSNAEGNVAPADSAPLLRFNRATKRVDTLAFVQLAKGNTRAEGNANGMMVMTGLKAFPSRDDWIPLPDGGVGIARVRDYHVDRYSPAGVRTSGPPLTVSAVPVTDAEKAAWRAERGGLAAGLGRGGAPPKNLPPPPQAEFPEVMPPFVAASLFAAPNGELWVLRSHRFTDVPVYDVFNAAATMSRRVALPATKARLVGFGNRVLYIVRRDADDLEYLQRYRLP